MEEKRLDLHSPAFTSDAKNGVLLSHDMTTDASYKKLMSNGIFQATTWNTTIRQTGEQRRRELDSRIEDLHTICKDKNFNDFFAVFVRELFPNDKINYDCLKKYVRATWQGISLPRIPRNPDEAAQRQWLIDNRHLTERIDDFTCSYVLGLGCKKDWLYVNPNTTLNDFRAPSKGQHTETLAMRVPEGILAEIKTSPKVPLTVCDNCMLYLCHVPSANRNVLLSRDLIDIYNPRESTEISYNIVPMGQLFKRLTRLSLRPGNGPSDFHEEIREEVDIEDGQPVSKDAPKPKGMPNIVNIKTKTVHEHVWGTEDVAACPLYYSASIPEGRNDWLPEEYTNEQILDSINRENHILTIPKEFVDETTLVAGDMTLGLLDVHELLGDRDFIMANTMISDPQFFDLARENVEEMMATGTRHLSDDLAMYILEYTPDAQEETKDKPKDLAPVQ